MSWVRRIDVPLVLVVLALSGLGLVLIYSATDLAWGPGAPATRQAIWLALGLATAVLFAAVDYEFWGRHHGTLYALGLALLAAVLVIGVTVQGAQRWLALGPVGFQPSEVVKLLLVVTLARLLADADEPMGLGKFLAGLAVALTPAGLVALQPDLGTAVVLVGSAGVMLFLAGARTSWLAVAAAFGAGVVPLVLHDYQRERLLTFLDPTRDPAGAGWNLIQSQIAVGSGRLWGSGLFQGSQKQLHFVPEQHTDFIFTVAAEEMGLVGSVALFLLLLYLVAHGVRATLHARDRFGSLLAGGLAGFFALHLLVNVGMVVGLLPVTGLPLPFLSYGGTALVVSCAAVGLMTSVWTRRRLRPRRYRTYDESLPLEAMEA